MPTLLTGDAGPVATIGYWSGGEPVAPFAAAELQSYLKDITESELPLEAVETTAAGDAAADTHADSGVASAVVPERGETAFPGETEFSLSTQLEPVADWLAGELDDAFTPYMDDVVVLAGTTHRGTLYTVYALLERLGVSFSRPTSAFMTGITSTFPTARHSTRRTSTPLKPPISTTGAERSNVAGVSSPRRSRPPSIE